MQTVVCGLACYGLWILLRRTLSFGAVASWIVAGGFLIRAFAGQVLFWISYLDLPVAKELHLGDGFWFFGLDGQGFYRLATAELAEGPRSILFIDKTLPAAFFVQVLAFFLVVFGPAPSVALLLNLFAYVGMSAAIVAWGAKAGQLTPGARVALLAVGFTPSWVLWSTQPLKDAFFVFVTVLFVFGLARVEELWLGRDLREQRLRLIVITTVLLIISMYSVAGIRWYFALLLWAGAMAFFMLLIVLRRTGRLHTAALSLLVAVLTGQALVYGAGSYLPPQLRALFSPATTAQAAVDLPKNLTRMLKASRQTQEAIRGATTLHAGPVLMAADQTAGAAPLAASPRSSPPPSVASVERLSRVNESIRGPRSTGQRLLVGMAAMVLPRSFASRLGLVHIEGGRGLWLFAELDTLVFDLFLLIAAVFLIQAFKARLLGSPILWFLVLAGCSTAAAVSYVSTNYGTLFRHRGMVMVLFCLIPVAVSAVREARIRSSQIHLRPFDPAAESPSS